MTTRPSGKAPTWATNETFVGGDAAGTVTKIAAGTTIEQNGWRPGFKMGARRRNALDNSLALWAGYHDAIEALNWSDVAYVGTAADNAAKVSMCSAAAGRTYIAIDDEIHMSRVGRSFTAMTVGTPQTIGAIASVGNVVAAATLNDEAVIKYHTIGVSTTFTHLSIAATAPEFKAYCGIGFKGAMYFGGKRANAPRVVKVTDAFVPSEAYAPVGLPAGFAPSCIVTLAAASPDLLVMIAWDVDTAPAVFTSPDGAAWTVNRPALSPADTSFHDLLWDPISETFELIAADGTIWESSDGATWNARVASPSLDIVNAEGMVTLAGGLWLAVTDDASLIGAASESPCLMISRDRGETWEPLYNLHEGGSTYGLNDFAHVGYSGGRFWAFRYPDAGADPWPTIVSMRVE